MANRNLRIHGDNIIECKRTLKMIAEAYKSDFILQQSPVYCPKYTIRTSKDVLSIELLSGHGRWGNIDLGEIVYNAGGGLRESADAYITEIIEDKEKILFAIEYCSALPAGNNAWQRNGRALASVLANIPYLYYAEIGGVELDEARNPKALRYPNPAVPFSYITLTKDEKSLCMPIYRAHPSMTSENLEIYQSSLGYDAGLTYIRQKLDNEDTTQIEGVLLSKALRMVNILAKGRKRKDILIDKDWSDLLNAKDRCSWLIGKETLKWQKKVSGKVLVSATFVQLRHKIEDLGVSPIISKDLPFCIIPKQKVSELRIWMQQIYKDVEINIPTKDDLAIVWITGFKPHGDDSRPDRGLSPLCRMILGKSAKILAVVSGPAKPSTWSLLENDESTLYNSNGLFQAIYTCCDYLLVDSATSESKYFRKTNIQIVRSTRNKQFFFDFKAKPEVKYFEHDIDCAIHQIFSAKEDSGIYECFCNPPGGDWSGITLFHRGQKYKWTSLPRVSESSKRPDHILQIDKGNQRIFITIESKGLGKNLETNIGNRLNGYINDLLKNQPTAVKSKGEDKWCFFTGALSKFNYKLISIGAFLYRNDDELSRCLTLGQLDAVFAFEFGDKTVFHFHSANAKGNIVKELLLKMLEQGRFVIKIH